MYITLLYRKAGHLIFRSLLLLALALPSTLLRADMVKVRHIQGTAHGFLILTTLQGKQLAVGDLIQTVKGSLVTSRLVFHFRDGSVDDETTVFTQRGTIRLISDRHVQKGPFFPHVTELNVSTDGHVTSRIVDAEGKVKSTDDHVQLDPDISNGLPLTLVLNLTESDPETRVSMLLMSGKPTPVHLVIRPDGRERIRVGGTDRMANRFILKIEIGGVKGVIAPLLGKEPKDYHVLFLGGAAPVFLRAEGQLYADGPVVRIQQTSATFADEARLSGKQ